MELIDRVSARTLLAPVLGALLFVAPSAAQTASPPPAKYPALPSETPGKFEPATGSFDYIKRDVMVPMRDGVKLHTVILVPRGAKGAPILLTRTPYNATELTSHAQSAHLGPILTGYDNATEVIVEGGYIRVVQDVRGKHGSEGDYVMNRPLHGPQNPTPVDHATDTYDTIDWLVKNVPESNGKVGILGISYDGFLPLMALVNPHPALKVSVPMNPMVDGWMGDDWFHNGAFRQQGMAYIYEQEADRKSEIKWWTSHFDDYDMFMQAGSAGELGRRRGLEQVGFWRKLLAHPSYDAFWRDQAVDKLLAVQPLKVPVMLVHSLWDQEDIYGAIAVYQAIKPKDTGDDKVFLVMGPWHHGQEIHDGSTLGALRFDSDTALYFRREILRPFLDRYLKDDAPKADVPRVMAFETGTNTWRRLPAWLAGCASGCTVQPTPLHLAAGLKLSFAPPKPGDAAFEEYVSDPAKPVPFRARPIQPVGYDKGLTWSQWLVDDQREASGRPDVVAFVSDPLTAPVKISGQPIANLVASTSGTDSDWVVKLIDVSPDEVAGQPALGGYQLMVSADIFRGRYRESLETAKPIAPNEPLPYRFALPTANHVFLPGHRIMVQVQSSWFPLYDRNPQTFVPSIFWAKPGDYRKAVQRIYHAPGQASFIELLWSRRLDRHETQACRSMTLRVAALLAFLALLELPAASAQSEGPSASAPGAAPAIQDNSFLMEEAYNQEWGVVQHISGLSRSFDGGNWVYTFTQEWPVRGLKHQLSFSLPLQHAEAGDGLGDLALNYRYQLLGSGEARVACAPRLSLLLPTGNERKGLGAGGLGLQTNVAASFVLSARLVTHLNLGGTRVPSARNASGQNAGTTAVNAGHSLVWLVSPRFNVLLETVWVRSHSVVGPGATERSDSLVVSPGIRWAYNLPSGLQIVPGIALPIGVGPSRGERSLFLYLSFEHPFKRRQSI